MHVNFVVLQVMSERQNELETVPEKRVDRQWDHYDDDCRRRQFDESLQRVRGRDRHNTHLHQSLLRQAAGKRCLSSRRRNSHENVQRIFGPEKLLSRSTVLIGITNDTMCSTEAVLRVSSEGLWNKESLRGWWILINPYLDMKRETVV